MNIISRGITACGLWVAASAFMCFGTLDTLRSGQESPFLEWGLFLTALAWVPTGWVLLRRVCGEKDETTLEDIVQVVEALHGARESTTHLHHSRR